MSKEKKVGPRLSRHQHVSEKVSKRLKPKRLVFICTLLAAEGRETYDLSRQIFLLCAVGYPKARSDSRILQTRE